MRGYTMAMLYYDGGAISATRCGRKPTNQNQMHNKKITSLPTSGALADEVCRKSFFTVKTDKCNFCVAFSCGRRGTAVAVDEE